MIGRLLLVCLLLSGCEDVYGPNETVTGQYGGENVSMVLTESGGQLVVSCTSYTLSGPLTLDANLGFVLTATAGTTTLNLRGRIDHETLSVSILSATQTDHFFLVRDREPASSC